jgi:dimethylamine/trimethylamine dehydrogenase
VRGYQVVLAEATRELGGRVARESQLPGLAAWVRVLDYREQAIGTMPNVEVYRESRMTADDIVEFGFQHVAVATGATWRRDGVARWHTQPIPVDSGADVLTPDDLMAGRRPSGSRVLVYDDDHYYMGGVVAELLRSEGFKVEIVTPAAQVSAWTVNTMEVGKVQRRLLLAGVTLRTSAALTAVGAGKVTVANTYTGQLAEAAADNVVMVTARLPDEELYLELLARLKQGEIASVRAIGDAWAPGTIAAAVWSGRRFAEEFDAELPSNDVVPFRREVTQLHADPAPTGQ